MIYIVPFRLPWPFLVCFFLVGPLSAARAASPSTSLPNPHPVSSTSPMPIGSYSAPALLGWSREVGDWPLTHAVYYRRSVESNCLMAKVVYVAAPRGVKFPSLRQQKASIEKELKAHADGVVTISKIIQYHNRPALLLIREVRHKNETEQIKSLLFNDGADNYEITMYVHNSSPAGLKVADKGWQELTGGLRKQV